MNFPTELVKKLLGDASKRNHMKAADDSCHCELRKRTVNSG